MERGALPPVARVAPRDSPPEYFPPEEARAPPSPGPGGGMGRGRGVGSGTAEQAPRPRERHVRAVVA
jgi:hypothetical protein